MNMIADCMKSTGGNMPATLLYMRLSYWMSRAKVVRYGKFWVAKTREEWAEETGLSIKQIKTALSVLKAKGIIATKQLIFGNKSILHARLEETTPEAQNEPPVAVPTGSAHKQGDTTRSYNTDTVASSLHEYASAHVCTGEEPVSGGDEVASVKEMLEGAKVGPTKKPLKNPTAKFLLGEIWQKGVHAHTKVVAPPLTSMQYGQLAMFAKACPPGKAEEILEVILKDWHLFTAQAKSDAGLHNVPALPSVGFVLKNVFTAINFGKSSKTPQKLVKTPSDAGTKAVQLTSQVGGKSETKLSKDEVMKILNSDD